MQIPKVVLPDLTRAAEGPRALLAEIRRSLNSTAESIEGCIPKMEALQLPKGPREFLKGLRVEAGSPQDGYLHEQRVVGAEKPVYVDKGIAVHSIPGIEKKIHVA